MTDSTVANFDPALKQIYRARRVMDLTYNNHPFFGMVRKDENFGGRNYPLPLKYGNPQGRSHSFSTAQTNATELKLEDFVLTRNSDYAVATLTGELALAARGNEATFLEGMTAVIDGAFRALANNISVEIFRNGGGARGQVGSVATTTVTLSKASDAKSFEVGMEVESSETDGTSGSLQAGTATVTGIDRNAGTLTSDSNWTAQIATLDADDYLFVDGDFGVAVSGLEAWVPSAAPSTTAFFGVDRSVDSRLGGLRHSANGQSIEEALIEAQSIAAAEGGTPDTILMNHEDYRDLIMLVGSKNTYERITRAAQAASGAVADIGFRGVRLDGDTGPLDVIPDRHCPQGVAFVLQMDSWMFASLGAAPRLLDLDGNRVLRQSAADGYEVRVGYYGQLGCDAPGYNVRVAL